MLLFAKSVTKVKKTAQALFNAVNDDSKDVARRSLIIERMVVNMQNSFLSVSKCRVPVIACVQGLCIGGAIDLISAFDMVYADTSSVFSIKEVMIGMTPDLGTLNRVTYMSGNKGLLAELAFTGRDFGADTAKEIGLVSKVYVSREEMMVQARKVAREIASMSPVAVYGIKKTITFHAGIPCRIELFRVLFRTFYV